MKREDKVKITVEDIIILGDYEDNCCDVICFKYGVNKNIIFRNNNGELEILKDMNQDYIRDWKNRDDYQKKFSIELKKKMKKPTEVSELSDTIIMSTHRMLITIKTKNDKIQVDCYSF